METLGQRIRSLRKKRGLSQKELQDALGWGETRLSMYERDQRTPKIDLLRELARALQCSLDDLLSTEQIDNGKLHVVREATVPLISWVKAGSWADITDPFEPGEAMQWIAPQTNIVSPHTFALTVEGDSMTSPSGMTFPEGCIIVVDPDRSAKAGDYVVAKDVATQKATFKRLTTDGNRWYLKPLNPAYPAIEIDDPSMRVIGVAIEWQTGGKL